MPSPFQPMTPGAIRAALVTHLAKKLGWSGKAVDHLIKPLSNDEIARCLRAEPEETRAALSARASLAMAAAAQGEAA